MKICFREDLSHSLDFHGFGQFKLKYWQSQLPLKQATKYKTNTALRGTQTVYTVLYSTYP